MAMIKHIATGAEHALHASHLVGRSRECSLRLDSRQVSGEHAVFRWTGSAWQVRDLGSSNGTFVDGRRLSPGEVAVIARHTRIAFGDDSERFEVIDDAPPSARARSARGDEVAARGRLLWLPDEHRPELSVFEDGPGQWLAESMDGRRRRVVDGQEVTCGGQSWQLILPAVVEGTWEARGDQMSVAGVGLRFRVSQYEDLEQVAIVRGDEVVPLPMRRHMQLLLYLAQERLRARDEPGLHVSEHGWVEVRGLVDELFNRDPSRFHLWVFRAKKQLAEAGIADAGQLFEYREIFEGGVPFDDDGKTSATRKIRLGVQQIEIVAPGRGEQP